MLPIALDAMGGDHAPEEIVAGARLAASEHGIPILLVGRPDELGDTGGLPVLAASEVIAMDAEPGRSVRQMKDSSLVRAAQAVRDGQASAMVSAGNTGATMASALLRMGRIKGVARPAIATPIPRLDGPPVVLLDAGANSDCEPEWLVQFGLMGAVYARHRFAVGAPRVGLLSIGEEAGKGNQFVKATFAAMSATDWASACGASFVGNVEGRDLMGELADVAVTDGFTGNVALKAMEGTTKTVIKGLLEAFDATPEAREAARTLLPSLLPLYAKFSPETYGGAMLLGVDGVCIISHGSSNANAIRNALRVAHDMVEADIVSRLRDAVGAAE